MRSGIPVHGSDPALAFLGTKSGARELFARAGVQHPLGVERITGRAEAIAAIARVRAERPGLQQVVLKLDAGVSGEGNALIDLRGASADAIGERFDAMQLEADVPMARLSRAPGPRRDRRGAHHRRRSAQPIRPARARRRGADRLDARPDPERPALPRLPLPGRAGVRACDHRERPSHRRRAARRGRARTGRDRLRRRARRPRRLAGVRDRDQPPQGRHDASAGGARAAVGRCLRPGRRGLHHAVRRAATLRRLRTTSSRRGCGRSATAACCGSPRCHAWRPTVAGSSSTC